ncbi:FAD-dependent monooxygenase [Actinomadura litoris]|uniref:FAD-dependent monooxygenase n=1 Tax=Actinomadura litoris TaxID=2678616 RepID=UPI001FA76D48|nr:FAD-dependent monooxygenase [Actinomadura litoris]
MRNTTVLVSGASIAGTATAYWLDRHGFEVTVVELSPGPRPGGQAIDVRGPALDVAERMGVLDGLRRRSTALRGMSVVDTSGKELYRTDERTFSGGDLDSPDVEILRDDLAALLSAASGDRVEYLFGDSIATLDQDGAGVRVVFDGGTARTFDLVVGADGLRSNTRRLAFEDPAPLRYLGGYLGVWTAPNTFGLDHWQTVIHTPDPDTYGAMMMSVRDDTEIRAYVGFESPDPIDYDHRDVPAQRRLLASRYADADGDLRRLVETMADAPDFHFDALAQVHLDTWSRGRVALVGDAGYCGSPASGQGTSMAMVGAYVLAGELKAAGGDHVRAFAAYEDELRDYVTANQAFGERGMTDLGEELARLAEGAESPEPYDLAELAAVVDSYKLKSY